jgi:hypothetical protein
VHAITRITVELTIRRYHDDQEDLFLIIKGVAEPVGSPYSPLQGGPSMGLPISLRRRALRRAGTP